MATVLDDVRVEVAFDAPMNGVRSWTDMTSRALLNESIGITRGQTDPFSTTTSAGSCTVTFDNTDGALTPGRTSSPYYPNVKPQNGLRVTYRDRSVDGNILSAEDSSFEGGTVGSWLAGGSVPPAIANSATRAQVGTKSLRITWGAGGSFPAVQLAVPGLVIGRTYTVSAYVYVPTGTLGAYLVVADPFTFQASSTTNAWQRLSVTFVATMASTTFSIWPNGVPAGGEQIWLDAVQVDEGALRIFTTTDPPIAYRFTGFIDSWPLSWPKGGQEEAWVSVTAFDLIARLSRTPALGSVIDETYNTNDCRWHFRLDEGSDSQSAGDARGSDAVMKIAQIGTGGTLEFGTGTGPGTDGSSAVMLTPVSAGNGKYLTTSLGGSTLPVRGGFDHGQTIVATFSTTGTGSQAIFRIADVYGSFLEIATDSSGRAAAKWYSTFGIWTGHSVETITGTTTVNDGQTHVVAVTLGDGPGGTFSSSRMRLFVDGVQEGSTVTWSTFDVIYGANAWAGGIPSGFCFTGTLSHLAYLGFEIDSTKAAQLAAANLTGFAGETSGARVSRICDWVGLPSELRSIATGVSTVDHVDPTGKSPWSYVEDVSNTEGGFIYVDARGRLGFAARTSTYDTARVPAATLVADDLGDDLEIVTDLSQLANDVTVSRARGAESRVTDPTSIGIYGAFGESLNTISDTDRDAFDRASWVLAVRSTPSPTIPNLTLDALTSSAAASVRGIGVFVRLAVSGLPSQVPDMGSISDLRVFGYREQIGAGGWQIACNTGPYLYVRPMIADDPVYGVADANNRAVY